MKDLLITWFPAAFAVAFLIFVLSCCKAAAKAIPRPSPVVLDVVQAMRAIVAIEGAYRYSIGPAGERSEFQLTKEVWEQHSKHPFWWASSEHPAHRLETLRVVQSHMHWIERTIKNQHPTRWTEYAFFEVWKGGWGRFDRCTMRPEDIDYAHRAVNLYLEK